MPTILITGSSTGFGHDIARHFLEQGWHVIATMRTPDANTLPASDRLRVLALDVTDAASIAGAIASAGPIDVLVNNAGIGFLNALEGTDIATARAMFETNTLGTIAMTQAVLPQFREHRAGVIINVSSSVTAKPLHLLSVYSASKAAVNAFTESLALEIAQFNIRAHLVLPGRAPDTQFVNNARTRMTNGFPEPYAQLAQDIFANWETQTLMTQQQDVSDAVWLAATDPTAPMRIPAGADAKAAFGD